MAEDSAMASPAPMEVKFDPKKLGRLALARRALSMDDASARWNISLLSVSRSSTLDAKVPSSSLDLNSLRTLVDSPTKCGTRTLSKDANERGSGGATKAVDQRTQVHVSGAASMEDCSQRYGQRKHDVSHQTCTRRKQPSVRTGVGDEAIAALSVLARRQSRVAPSIILPSNRPFLVGETANRLFHREAESTGEYQQTRFRTDESMDHKPNAATTSPSGPPRKEASNITIALSKLLFFGGSTPPAKERPQYIQCIPDAVQLSPDVTMISHQSDSCSSHDLEHSYLLQLGHIMGAPGFPHSTLQAKEREGEESVSEISSLEHYCSVAPESDCPRHCRRFLRFLFLVACMSTSFLIFGDNEYIIKVYEQAEHSIVQTARESYSIVSHRTEILITETREVVHSKAREKLDSYIDVEQTLLVLARWQNLTFNAYMKVKDLLADQTHPPDQIIRASNRCTSGLVWAQPVEISTAMMLVEPITITSIRGEQALEVTTNVVQTVLKDADYSDDNDGQLISHDKVHARIGDQTEEDPASSIEHQLYESVADEPQAAPGNVGSDCEEGTLNDSSSTEGNMTEEATQSTKKLSEVHIEQVISSGTAKDRLQAAAKEELMQAMGQQVASLLGLPRSSSFTLSLTAKAAFCTYLGDRTAKHNISVPLSSRKFVNGEVHGGLTETSFDEIFSCPQSDVVSQQYRPSRVRSICRVSEVSVLIEEAKPDNNILAGTEDEDEFLQKPLVEVVVDFFRERRKRRELKRQARRRRK